MMAVGKSTIGRHLAVELGYVFYDSDRVIEERSGADVSWIFDVEGEEGFRARETQVIEELSAREGIVLATGGGSIASERNRQLLAARGLVIWLQTPLRQLVLRTRRDRRRPLLRNSRNLGETLRRLLEERGPLYESIANLSFCADESSPRVVAKQIARQLRAGAALDGRSGSRR